MCRSIFVTPEARGSAVRTKIPIACCANISQKGPTCQCTARQCRSRRRNLGRISRVCPSPPAVGVSFWGYLEWPATVLASGSRRSKACPRLPTISSRSSSARAAKIPNMRRPSAVVVSIIDPSPVRAYRPIPRAVSSPRVLTRWRRPRPSRSKFQNTSVTTKAKAARHAFRPGLLSQAPRHVVLIDPLGINASGDDLMALRVVVLPAIGYRHAGVSVHGDVWPIEPPFLRQSGCLVPRGRRNGGASSLTDTAGAQVV